jgi:Rne/Rng family ribonuclease
MNKELFVSSTPHETRVGIVEDDQLAEIYLERENEYTLAGSIYKGRVTRVLPGMQSAFVDIGLERDAFLYVSDFMDLEQQDEDLDEAVPTNRPVPETVTRQTEVTVQTHVAEPTDSGDVDDAVEENAEPETTAASNGGTTENSRDGRGWRGRRRRRGRRGERFERDRDRDRSAGESRSQRPQNQPTRVGRDYDYGPPAGYQPILLPGESISKYQRQAQNVAAPVETATEEQAATVAIPEIFPEDEPLFASQKAEPLHEEHEHITSAEVLEPVASAAEIHDRESEQRAESGRSWEVAPLRVDAEHMESAEVVEPSEGSQSEEPQEAAAGTSGHETELAHEADFRAALQHPDVEEQEIDEEEADLAAYVEELEEDAAFEEMEEETHDVAHASQEKLVAVSEGEPSAAAGEQTETAENGEETAAPGEEEEDEESVEAELEEAQEEAEALLEAESIGEGTVDASAEVRSAAPTARLQRATRPSPGYGRRGGRRPGGRRFRRRENHVIPQISDLLKEGQEVLIQIAKEPIGKKGARITSHIALPGRFLVFMPTVNHTGVSRKISSEEERQRLKRIIQSERENGHGGFIVRTAAQNASEDELRADIRFLKNLWNEIKTRSDESKSPALIYHDLNVVERVLRDQVTSDFSVIWVDTEQEYERILRFANRFQPALVKRVKLYTKETPLYEQFGLNEEISKALKSKVWLKSGGYIVINQTEALVAIDVNTGKYVGKTARLEDTIVKTNVDAIKEIVRQVRLRDLGGIIVIDFIDMDERRNRQKVMQALEEALRYDRAPSKVLQFNDFGLVAITRKRVKQSLERTIGTPCPYCQATGFVKSVTTICNEIYVEMRKMNKHLEHSDVMVRVHPEVAKALKTNNAKLLNEMEELTKKTIIVKSDPALHQEQFDIH